MDITKASGETEEFNEDKLCGSIEAVGVAPKEARNMCVEIKEGLKPGATTTHIWRTTLRMLAKKNLSAATRYNIRRGLAALGPAGFLFEQFVETLLQALGYETKRNQMVKGECVTHEVDVVAEKEKNCFLIEAKYHNRFGTKVATDIVMYADARQEDVARGGKTCGMWVFTNTKFSGNAKKYGQCRGLKMTGWRYPKDEGLESLVVKYALYPVTCLPSVDKFAREQFARHGMMLAQDVAPYSADALAEKFSIPSGRAEKIAREARTVIQRKINGKTQ